MTTMTLHAFAKETGIPRQTLSRRLADLDLPPAGKNKRQGGGAIYSIRDLVAAASGGDLVAERIRKTQAETRLLEIKRARLSGELIDVESVIRLGEAVFVRVRAKILSSPSLIDEEKDALLGELLRLREIDWERDI